MNSQMTLARSVIALCAGLAVGIGLTALSGESPWHVAQVLFKSAFGTRYDFGMTLFFAAPILLTGLSVALAFRVGLFNIGAEGQLVMGALFAVVASLTLPFESFGPFVGIGIAVVAAFLGGAFWGWIPGWLKAKRGSHEVINTILLNFIAAGIANYVVLYVLRNTETQNPETHAVPLMLQATPFAFFDGAPVTFAVFGSAIVAVLVYGFLEYTRFGFWFRVVGESETVAERARLPVGRVMPLAFALSGGLAGLVGAIEVLAHSGKLKLEFSPGYGFIGIAVALLARGNPLAVIPSALLFGALQKGALDLDLETENVTREWSLMLQAIVILSVASERLWIGSRRERSKRGAA